MRQLLATPGLLTDVSLTLLHQRRLFFLQIEARSQVPLTSSLKNGNEVVLSLEPSLCSNVT